MDIDKNLIPTIEFRTSWIYNENWKEWVSLYPHLSNLDYPSWDSVLVYSRKIEEKWNKIGKEILREISILSKLQWSEDKIVCYLVGRCIPFSDPLTLHVSYESEEDFMNVLIHEMIHQILIQDGNNQKTADSWSYFDEKYKEETITTRNHILLHAIHQKIILKFFNQQTLERERTWAEKKSDYKRSWEIVEKEGPENIINSFISKLK